MAQLEIQVQSLSAQLDEAISTNQTAAVAHEAEIALLKQHNSQSEAQFFEAQHSMEAANQVRDLYFNLSG